MTLVLNEGTTPELEVKTFGELDGNVVHLAVEVDTGDLPGGGGLLDISVSLSDFLDAARYVLTNTDLVDDDLRLKFLRWLQSSVVGPGHNPGSLRILLAEPAEPSLVEAPSASFTGDLEPAAPLSTPNRRGRLGVQPDPGERVLLQGDHPWAGHAGVFSGWGRLASGGYRPVVRLDLGPSVFIMDPISQWTVGR